MDYINKDIIGFLTDVYKKKTFQSDNHASADMSVCKWSSDSMLYERLCDTKISISWNDQNKTNEK